MENKFESLILS